MTPFAERIQNIYGSKWGYITRASRDLSISYSSLHEMMNDKRPIPSHILMALEIREHVRNGKKFSSSALDNIMSGAMQKAIATGWTKADFLNEVRCFMERNDA